MAMEPVGPAAQWLLPLRRAPAVSPPSGSYRPRRPAAPTAASSLLPFPPSSRRPVARAIWSDGRWFIRSWTSSMSPTASVASSPTTASSPTSSRLSLGMWNGPTRPMALEGLTALELTGAGRTGLISEVFAVLADMDCGVVEGRAWMHRVHLGCLIFLRNEETDTERMARIEAASDTSSSATPSAPAAAPWPPAQNVKYEIFKGSKLTPLAENKWTLFFIVALD
ncbi:hypothetical protein OsI_08795 [Oryza sativa Indica Group]|uniref:Uncharacterized protein n=1 Tax=Oryza sativa subsp. indica TaxID=39946 RepID=A2X978_ORYSI|nr:hypothetical protein OsI_08795 [Oryza sativa Indica Group]